MGKFPRKTLNLITGHGAHPLFHAGEIPIKNEPIHAFLGRDADSFNELLARMMENIRPGDLAACNAIIANKEIPAMGSLQVIHHSYCYRIHHFGLMKQRLAQVTDLKAFTKEFLRQSQSASNESQ